MLIKILSIELAANRGFRWYFTGLFWIVYVERYRIQIKILSILFVFFSNYLLGYGTFITLNDFGYRECLVSAQIIGNENTQSQLQTHHRPTQKLRREISWFVTNSNCLTADHPICHCYPLPLDYFSSHNRIGYLRLRYPFDAHKFLNQTQTHTAGTILHTLSYDFSCRLVYFFF